MSGYCQDCGAHPCNCARGEQQVSEQEKAHEHFRMTCRCPWYPHPNACCVCDCEVHDAEPQKECWQCSELLTRLIETQERNATLEKAAQALSDFAWSAVTPDCMESGRRLNRLLGALRAALSGERPAPSKEKP